MADLAAVTGGAAPGAAADDEAAADPDLARHVQDVIDADRCPSSMLGQHAEVGLVADRDGHLQAERPGQSRPERDVEPAEVRGHRDEPVAAAHDAGDGDGGPDQRRSSEAPVAEVLGEPGEIRRDRLDRRMAAGPVDTCLCEDVAADAHDRGRQRVDGDVEDGHRGRSRD